MNTYDLIRQATCRAAIERYGGEAQKRMALEELAELMVAINHDLRGRDSNLEEEIADVEIMLEQLKMIDNCEGEVERIKRLKIERLKRRLEE